MIKLLKQYFDWSKEHKGLNCIFLIYAFIISFVYLHYNVLIFDEAWYFGISNKLILYNERAYGTLYWIFMYCFHNKLLLRIISLCCILSILPLIYKYGRKFKADKKYSYLLMVLWITFPVAWWFGKLLGPEIYCLALANWGLYLVFPSSKTPKQKYIGIFLMAIATGIRTMFVLFPFFYFVYNLLNSVENKKIKDIFFSKKYWIFYTISLFGFIVASPDILYQPITYIENLKVWRVSGSFGNLKTIYSFNVSKTWDIYNYGLMSFSLSFLPIIYIIYCFLKRRIIIKNKKIVISFFLSFLAWLFLLSQAYGYLNYYALPIISLLLLLFYSMKIEIKDILRINILNFIVSSSFIFIMLWGKSIEIMNYKNLDRFNIVIQEFENKMKSKYGYSDGDYKKFILIETPKSSGIFLVNDSLAVKSFDSPTFIVIHKILIKTHAKTKTPYHYIHDVILTDNVLRRYEKDLYTLKETGHKVEKLGEYKDLLIFMIVPNNKS